MQQALVLHVPARCMHTGTKQKLIIVDTQRLLLSEMSFLPCFLKASAVNWPGLCLYSVSNCGVCVSVALSMREKDIFGAEWGMSHVGLLRSVKDEPATLQAGTGRVVTTVKLPHRCVHVERYTNLTCLIVVFFHSLTACNRFTEHIWGVNQYKDALTTLVPPSLTQHTLILCVGTCLPLYVQRFLSRVGTELECWVNMSKSKWD